MTPPGATRRRSDSAFAFAADYLERAAAVPVDEHVHVLQAEFDRQSNTRCCRASAMLCPVPRPWPCSVVDDVLLERRQAAYLDRTLRLARTRWRVFVDAVVVFGLQDDRRGDREYEARFGVLRRDGRPKPAWDVVRNASRR